MAYKYIHFVVVEEKPKTKVWSCRNNHSATELGRVAYYGPWRQYCFLPSEFEMLVFSAGCLDDISDFVKRLNDERKKAKEGGA